MKMRRDELILLLQFTLEQLCKGETMEGSISYTTFDEDLEKDEFLVTAAVRYGQPGQGYIKTVGG